jgi:colanic acid biosynthesis glycosyl transferase WcaI
MRVLFVNQYYPPDVSATAYLLGELAEDLAAHHEIWVIAGRPSYNPEAGSYQPQSVHLERTWSTRFKRAGMAARLVNYATFVLSSLTRALRVPRPQVVVAMTDPPVIGLIGLLAAWRHRCPFVYICEDIFPDVGVALKRADNPLVVWLWRKLNRLLRRRATRIVAIGRDMQEKLITEGVPEDKIVYLPNWAGEQPNDKALRASVRETMAWDGKFVVMHGGNVGLAQNLEVLIKAAEILRDRSEVRFVVVGDGAARAGLQSEARHLGLENVEFIPYRPKHEAQALLGAADLHTITLAGGLWGCVVPSKVYGILALGRPFVAAVDTGSEIDRIIEETGAGVRVEPGDATSLAQAIREFADGSRDAQSAGRRGRAEFEAKFARHIVTDRYRELLEALAESTTMAPDAQANQGDRGIPAE